MPSKYSRKNRDRRGGHETSEVVFASGSHYNGKAVATPIERAALKHITKKVARRQHAKTIAEGLLDYEQQQEDANGYFQGVLPGTYGFVPYEEEPEEYDYSPFDDSYYYDYSYPGCECHECTLARIGRQTQARLRSETVGSADAGKSIATLLEERGFRL